MKAFRAAVAFLALAFLSSAAKAAGDVTPPNGAPFCIEQDHLQEYMMAMLKHDDEWMKQLRDCVVLRGGVRIGVIEEMPGSELGHVSKVRVISNGSSVVGYILVLDLQ